MNFTECNTETLQRAAEIYRAAGLKLTPVRPGTKEAYLTGWNKAGAGDPTPADHWVKHPADNIGMLLYASGIVVLDIDDLTAFLQAMHAIGLDAQTSEQTPFYRGSTAGIRSGAVNEYGHKKGKLIFTRPAGSAGDALTYHKLNWRDDDGKSYTVFELRTGSAEKDIQDVLPPSIHPKTGQPYQWVGGDIAPIPRDLYTIWAGWDVFADDLTRADPNYVQESLRVKPPARRHKDGEPTATEIIRQWNDSQNIVRSLEQYGYIRIHGNRYLSPYSQSKNPGVIVNPMENKAFSFGASDPLTGRTIRPFDLLLEYEYKGRTGDAVKYIKEQMGYSTEQTAAKRSARATTGPTAPAHQDPQTDPAGSPREDTV